MIRSTSRRRMRKNAVPPQAGQHGQAALGAAGGGLADPAGDSDVSMVLLTQKYAGMTPHCPLGAHAFGNEVQPSNWRKRRPLTASGGGGLSEHARLSNRVIGDQANLVPIHPDAAEPPRRRCALDPALPSTDRPDCRV